MKNLFLASIVVLVLLVSNRSEAATAYTEICLDPGGLQINGGSDTNTTAAYTSLSGVWDGTSLFIPTDSSTPAATLTNQFASVYPDGTTLGVYIARVVAVTNGVNGGITLSTTAKVGTAPTVGTRSIKIGGAIRGPLLNDPWPINTVNSNLVNAAGNPVCINWRGNNGNYTSTNSFTNTASGLRFSGYTNTFRDGGLAKIFGLTTGGSYQMFVNSGVGCVFSSLEFGTNGATTSSVLFINSGANSRVAGCVFHDSRGDGFKSTATCDVEGNEAYHNGLNNSANVAGIEISQVCNVRNNFIHNNNGTNINGILSSSQCSISGNIISSNGLNGITYSGTVPIQIINNDIDANAGSGVDLTGTALIQVTIQNNNFFKNGAWAVTSSGSSLRVGTASYNSFGAGTEANVSGNFDSNLGAILTDTGNSSYPADTTPWTSPTTGNFALSSSLAIGTGGQTLRSTMSGFQTSLTGYPQRGALAPAATARTYAFPFAQ